MLVEVRSISSRPGAPARDAAAGRGRRRRRDRRDEGDVLQPAVARAQVPAGHAADAARQVPGPQPLPRRARTRTTEEVAAAGDAVAAVPGDQGAHLDADPGAGARAPRARSPTRPSRCPARLRARRAAARPARPRWPPRTSATTRAAAGGWPSRSCCSTSSTCCAGAASAATPRPRGARAATATTLTRRWLASMLPFAPTGDQERAIDAVDADLARAAADAAAADGRGRLGQDRRRAARDAARGRARHARRR